MATNDITTVFVAFEATSYDHENKAVFSCEDDAKVWVAAAPAYRKYEPFPVTDRAQYDAYVTACHSQDGVFVTEFSFSEWIEAGKPTGMRL
jgi:hypothetical protein